MFLESEEDYCPTCGEFLEEDGSCVNECIPEDDDEGMSHPNPSDEYGTVFYDDDLEDVVPGLDFIDEDDLQD